MKKLILTYTIILSILFSCDKNENQGRISNDGKVTLSLNYSFADNKTISTRSGNEGIEATINDLYLAIFTASSENDNNKDNILIEIIKANKADNGYSITLKPITDKCKIYTIANITDANNLAKITEGSTLADFLELKDGADRLSNKEHLPLYGDPIYMPNGIDKNASIELNLKKNYSKINLDFSNCSQFVAEAIYLLNSAESGYYTPKATPQKYENTIKGSEQLPSTPIYLFPNDGDNGNNPTHIIIKGKYNNNASTYYKLQLRYADKIANDYSYTIKNNTHFQVKLTEILNNGYETRELAETNAPSNIEYQVIITDPDLKDITINNGDYYIGLSNSELIVHSNDDLNNFELSKLVIGSILYKNGPVLNKLNCKIASDNNLIKVSFKSSSLIFNADDAIVIKSFPKEVKSAKITINIGNITKDIKIIRKPEIKYNENVLTDYHSADYIFAEREPNTEWVKFSTTDNYTNIDKIHSESGNINTKISINTTTSKRYTNIYLQQKPTQNNDGERVRVYITQQEVQKFTLKYFREDGVTEVASQEITMGQEFTTQTAIRPTNPNYKFLYWNTDKDGKGHSYSANVKLLATEAFLNEQNPSKILYAICKEKEVIEAPHTGWAYSNIYWDKEKQILTFIDETKRDCDGTIIKDEDFNKIQFYQGVFFKWGSLVAISPIGIWKPEKYKKGESQILYIPNTDQNTNGGWNEDDITNNSYNADFHWSRIPFVNDPFDYNLSDPDAPKRAYLIEAHNPQKNVGDICKYITEMGWAPGAKQGVRWRMPTSWDFFMNGMSDNNVFTSHGPFVKETVPLNEDYKQGRYITDKSYRVTRFNGPDKPIVLPACGLRYYHPTYNVDNYGTEGDIGRCGSYWSSTIAGSEYVENEYIKVVYTGKGLSFERDAHDGRIKLYPEYGEKREMAFAVRCVKEE